jgi:hypothetical protein
VAVGLKVKEVKSSSKEYPIKAYRDPNAVSFLDEPINWFKFSVTSLIQKCKTADDYVDAKNQYLEAVIDLEVEPGETPVQIMIMNQPVDQCTYTKFPVSISQIWYKDGKFNKTPDFMIGNKHNIIYPTGIDNSMEGKYTKKVREKFPEFEYLDSKEKVIQYILHKKYPNAKQFSVHESTDEKRNELIPFKQKLFLLKKIQQYLKLLFQLFVNQQKT